MTADIAILAVLLVIVCGGIYYIPRIFRRTRREEELERTEAPYRELAETNRFLGLLEDVERPEQLTEIVTKETERRRRAD